MKILRKITSIMASLPLVFSQASAMDKTSRKCQKKCFFLAGRDFEQSGIFKIIKVPRDSGKNISLEKAPTYTYHKFKVIKKGNQKVPVCGVCNQSVKDEYFAVVGDAYLGEVCKECEKRVRSYQCLVLIGDRVPDYDADKLNALCSDESFLSTLPIVIDEGYKVPSSETGRKIDCSICLNPIEDLNSVDYCGCYTCGKKACLECGCKWGMNVGRCPMCRKETYYRTNSMLAKKLILNNIQNNILHYLEKHSKDSYSRYYRAYLKGARNSLETAKRRLELLRKNDRVSKPKPNN